MPASAKAFSSKSLQPCPSGSRRARPPCPRLYAAAGCAYTVADTRFLARPGDLTPASPEFALSIIIAARNEAAYLPACLEALLTQSVESPMQVIVAANACTDDTAEVARSYAGRFAARGWRIDVIEVPTPGKPNALNAADAETLAPARAYLDADVICSVHLLRQMVKTLDRREAVYVTGHLQVAEAKSWVTRHYARLWTRLPFVTGGAVGAGLFAVNAAGRARWQEFPDIISDDTYVRMLFAPEERIEVSAPYLWPMVEGARNLVRVRRRQDAGVAEIHRLYPDLPAREGKVPLGMGGIARLAFGAPVSFAVYAAISLAVRARRSGSDWSRGR